MDTIDIGRTIMPEHPVCKANVAVPTLVTEPLREGGNPEVFVQWFADFSKARLGELYGSDAEKRFAEMQFRFPVNIPPDDIYWMGHPELFDVVMLGELRHWPNKNAIPSMGSPESVMLWVVSTHFTMGNGPACFAIPLRVKLADQVCGIIEPRLYLDLEVLERAKRKMGG